MIRRLSEFFVGLIFGGGLIISGMTNPAKVIGFLDISGAWDPSLMMVMGGAVGIGLIGFWIAKTRRDSVFGRVINLNDTKPVDVRLVAGAAVFGIGWGLSGLCPGPAIAALGTGEFNAILFVIAMGAGMGLHSVIERRTRN